MIQLFLICFIVVSCTASLFDTDQGPSSSVPTHVNGVAAAHHQFHSLSIITTNDKVDDYQFPSIPDGMGAFEDPENSENFIVMVVHENFLASISVLKIKKENLEVLKGDLIQLNNVNDEFWKSKESLPSTWRRFCSAGIPPLSATFDEESGLGINERIGFLAEEVDNGRLLAISLSNDEEKYHVYEIADGIRANWERSAPSPFAQQQTIVALSDDTFGGVFCFFIGQKQNNGTFVERAGLVNGDTYCVSIETLEGENEPHNLNDANTAQKYKWIVDKEFVRFNLVKVPKPYPDNRYELGAIVRNLNGTMFLRAEDAQWHYKTNQIYFTTTDSAVANNGHSKVFELTFDDITQPLLGGRVRTVINGLEPPVHGASTDSFVEKWLQGQMLDAITVDQKYDQLLLCEDGVDNNRILQYDLKNNTLEVLANHKPGVNGEFSGVLDVGDILGDGWFLADAQSSSARGQLFAFYRNPPGVQREIITTSESTTTNVETTSSSSLSTSVSTTETTTVDATTTAELTTTSEDINTSTQPSTTETFIYETTSSTIFNVPETTSTETPLTTSSSLTPSMTMSEIASTYTQIVVDGVMDKVSSSDSSLRLGLGVGLGLLALFAVLLVAIKLSSRSE